MKLIIASVVLLAALAVLTPAAAAFNPVEEVRCVNALLETLSNSASAEREWVESKRQRFEQLEAYREYCETIVSSYLQEKCLDTHEGMYALEVVRLLAELESKKEQSPELAAQLLRDFESCRSS